MFTIGRCSSKKFRRRDVFRQACVFLFFFPGLLLFLVLLPGCSVGERPISFDEKELAAGKLVGETWDVCLLGGARAGTMHTAAYDDREAGQDVRRVVGAMTLEVKRDGQTTKQKVVSLSIEKWNGELIRFASAMQLGAQPTFTRGFIKKQRLEYEVQSGEKKTPGLLEWSANDRGPNALEQSLAEKPITSGERRTLHFLYAGLGEPHRATLELLGGELEDVKLYDGSIKKLRRVDTVLFLTNNYREQSTLWIDEKGEILKTRSAAMNMEMFRVPKEVALAENTGPTFDLGRQTAIPVDKPISNPTATQKIRYRIHLDDADPLQCFAAATWQQIKRIDEHTAEVTVVSVRPGAKFSPSELEKTSPDDLAPNASIECDDPLVKKLAEEAAGNEKTPWGIAVHLERFVHDYIVKKDYSQAFATAAEVAKSRQGDCTEHGVLLAALLRAKNIPARIDVGLVYVPKTQNFWYHLWTEAFIDGRWIPLDATQVDGGIGADHLTLGRSNLKGSSILDVFMPMMQVAGKMKIEVLEVE